MALCRDEQLYVIGVEEHLLDEGELNLRFMTTRGDFTACARLGKETRQAVVMLGDDYSDIGPSGIYPDVSRRLFDQGIGSLQLVYRCPGDYIQCSIDTLLSVQYLDDEAVRDVILVGWGFGAAVALAVGSVTRNVKGVAALATVDVPTRCRRRLRYKPVLLVHGGCDSVSPLEVSRHIHDYLGEPKRMIVYPEAGHELVECRSRLITDLTDWIVNLLASNCVVA